MSSESEFSPAQSSPSRSLRAPVFRAGRWRRIGGEQSGRRIVALAARRADDFQSGLFGFHAQVADHHVVNAGLQAGKGFGGAAGGFHFKTVEFEDSFEGQQDGEVVVDEKNAAFHGAPRSRGVGDAAALRNRVRKIRPTSSRGASANAACQLV